MQMRPPQAPPPPPKPREYSFFDMFKLTLQKEGGYVNDKHDRGGETKFGVSKRAYPNEDIKNLTEDRAAQIYKKDYYDKVRGDDLPKPLAASLFDMAVNAGVRAASKLLQWILGEKEDGIVGEKTIKAANEQYKQDPHGLLDKYRDARIGYYKGLKQYDRYGRGWINRATEVNEAVKKWTEIS